MYASARCSGSHLLGEFSGSTKVPTTSSGVPPGPESNSSREGGGQQLFQVGKLGVSCLLTKLRLFIGATMAKLGPSFSFASVSCSQMASGADQAPTAQWGQCWSPKVGGRDSSQVQMLRTKSRRDSHMPASDPTTLFSVHTFTTIIQPEKGVEKEFFIPKKYLHPKVISSLCAACAPFFGRLRDLPQATEGGSVGDRVAAAATGSPSPSFPSR